MGELTRRVMEDNTDTGYKTAEKPDTLSKEYVSRGDVIDAFMTAITYKAGTVSEGLVNAIARNNYHKCLTVFTHTIDICTSPTLGVVMSAEMAGHIAQTQVYYVLNLSNVDDVVIQTVDAHFSSIDVLNMVLTTLRDDL